MKSHFQRVNGLEVSVGIDVRANRPALDDGGVF